MIGIALEVIDENGKPCAQRSARVHGVDYLIQQVRVFCSDSLEKLDKVIRRVVECINRTLNTIERKRASRSQWCDMTRKQKKFLYNRPSRTLVVPEFNLRSQIVLVQV